MSIGQGRKCRWAIVPAAGIGARFSDAPGSAKTDSKSDYRQPKQYTKILGTSMLEHSIRVLLDTNPQLTVLVALADNDTYWEAEAIAAHARVEAVPGGEQRADSVLSGLLALQGRAEDDDLILVHDAARPCVGRQDIDGLLSSIDDHPVGGLLASPVVDTLKQVDASGHVQNTVAREFIYRAQTPQAFRYRLLRQALEQAKSRSEVITDESSAIEKLGLSPLIVPGAADNIKVTFASDLVQAEHSLSARE